MIIPDRLDTPENFLPVTVLYTPPLEELFWSSSQVSPHEVEFIDVWRQLLWMLPTMPHCAWERGLVELTSFLDQPHWIETLNEILEAIDIVCSAHIGYILGMMATCQGKPPQETNNALLYNEDVQLLRQTT